MTAGPNVTDLKPGLIAGVDGDELYALTEAYGSIGNHRTGTPVDALTRAWLRSEFEARGLTVAEQSFDFPRYDVSWRLEVDGADVPSLPLFYSGYGRHQGVEPGCATATPEGAEGIEDLERLVRETDAGVLVLATGVRPMTPSGQLFAINRSPRPMADGRPILCVSDDDLARLGNGSVTADFAAGLTRGSTADLIVRTPGPGLPVLLTTPLNGWFGCAGERGTGIAILLHLVEQCAGEFPLVVVATAGHEIGGLGAIRLAKQLHGQVRSVVHVGASVAAAEPGPDGLRLTRMQRLAVRGVDLEAVAALSVTPPVTGDEIGWRGEASEWSTLGVPILSWTGGFPLFHTPADVAAASTTPRMLADQAASMTDIVRAMFG